MDWAVHGPWVPRKTRTHHRSLDERDFGVIKMLRTSGKNKAPIFLRFNYFIILALFTFWLWSLWHNKQRIRIKWTYLRTQSLLVCLLACCCDDQVGGCHKCDDDNRWKRGSAKQARVPACQQPAKKDRGHIDYLSCVVVGYVLSSSVVKAHIGDV